MLLDLLKKSAYAPLPKLHNICTEDGGEFAFKTFLSHRYVPNFMISFGYFFMTFIMKVDDL